MAEPENLHGKEALGFRQRIASWVERPGFTAFITILILVNAVTLGMETSESLRTAFGEILYFVDHAILTVFVAEIGLKLYAYRGRFFSSGWNIFDFAIVGISLLPASGPFAIMRTLRVFRVLRLISVVPRMRRVVAALLHAIPGMASIIAVLFVIFYVSAVLTTQLFSVPELENLFGSIATSMFTLFQVMTLEDWAEVARSVMAFYPLAWIFFVPFIIITSFAVLNLFIGIIVDAMNLVQEEDIEEEKQAAHEDTLALHGEIAALRAEVRALAKLFDK